MNPADIAASGLASPAMEVSLLGMFWSAHFVVKLVMVGLLASSVWCWAIIINKVLLFAKTNRAMAQFEDVFWSGASLDELYATLSSRPASGMAALFVAAMREWRRSVQGASSSFMGLQARIEKVLDVSIAREVEKLEIQPFGAGNGCLGGSLHRPIRHGLGHYDRVSLDRRGAQYFASGRRAGHSGGAFRDRDRVVCGNSGSYRL